LGDDIIGSPCKVLVRDGFDLKGEVEVAKVFEGDGRHTDLILLCWYFDDWGVLIRFVEVFDADDLRNLALRIDG